MLFNYDMSVMKKLLSSLFVMFLFVSISYSQSYNVINYQGSMRHPDGSPFAGKEITLRLTIIETVQNGNSLYYEIRKVTTNSVGLYSVSVGSDGMEEKGGTPLSDIKWGSGAKFLRIEIDPNADYNFMIANTIPLTAVPYAMHASQGGTSGFNYWKQLSGNEDKSYQDYFAFVKQATIPQIKAITSAYMVTKADAGVTFWISGNAAFPVSFASDLPVGFTCNFVQKNATEFATTFSGVKSFQNVNTLAGQFAEASIVVPEAGYVLLKGQLK